MNEAKQNGRSQPAAGAKPAARTRSAPPEKPAGHVKPNIVQRPPRWSLTADLTVVDDLGRELYSRLWNISDGGFMAECEEKLRIGQIVEVVLPIKGAVKAEVRWVLGWRFGAMILAEADAA